MCRAKLTQLKTKPSLRLHVLEMYTPTYMQIKTITVHLHCWYMYTGTLLPFSNQIILLIGSRRDRITLENHNGQKLC